jgi:hypothetical protein
MFGFDADIEYGFNHAEEVGTVAHRNPPERMVAISPFKGSVELMRYRWAAPIVGVCCPFRAV